MAPNNEDNTNRDHSNTDQNNPFDNPFIAFRRFVDRQVSAIIDPLLDHRLNEMNRRKENDDSDAPRDSQNQQHPEFRDLPPQVRDELLRRKAREELRNQGLDIVRRHGNEILAEQSRREGGQDQNEKRDKWDWGFPQPFDAQERNENHDGEQERQKCHWRRRWDDEERHHRWHSRWHCNRNRQSDKQDDDDQDPTKPKVYTWSWNWSYPPASSSSSQSSTEDRSNTSLPPSLTSFLSDLYTDFETFFDDVSSTPWFPMHSGFTLLHILASPRYSPRALESDYQLGETGIQWRDAFEDLIRAEQSLPPLPDSELGKSSQLPYGHWARRFWHRDLLFPEQTRQRYPEGYPKQVPLTEEPGEEKEVSYEYSHDHEDQHDDPPTPRPDQGAFPQQSQEPQRETELEAYQQLLALEDEDQAKKASTTTQPEAQITNSKILSTLTTTERTVASDGTVTTKMVLKKRFADGREESSETVNVERGQEKSADIQSSWDAMRDAHFPSSSEKPEAKAAEKKNGWFWK